MTFSDTALITAGAGTLGAIISLASLLIGKEQKVSEFRQAWIDALRQDVVTLISNAYALQESRKRRLANETGADDWNILHPVMGAINEAGMRIQLRVNPVEGAELFKALGALNSAFSTMEPPTQAVLTQLVQNILVPAQLVLKENWKIVKRGEPIYRIAKYTTLVLALLFASILWYGFNHQEKPANSGFTISFKHS